MKRCPRCGKMSMRDVDVENALSRYCDEYICNECGNDEALNGEKPRDTWWIATDATYKAVYARVIGTIEKLGFPGIVKLLDDACPGEADCRFGECSECWGRYFVEGE